MNESSANNSSGELLLVAVVEMVAGHEEAGRQYEDAVLKLLDRHGGVVEQRLRSTDSATEVHLIRFASRAGYDSALADPDRLAMRAALGEAAPNTRVIEVREL